MMAPSPTRVMLLDDRELMHGGLPLFFRAFPDLELVGRVRNVPEAIVLYEERAPHVIAIDLKWPEQDSPRVTQFIHRACPNAQIIIITNSTSQSLLAQLLAAGARAVIHKDTTIDALASTLRAAGREATRSPGA